MSSLSNVCVADSQGIIGTRIVLVDVFKMDVADGYLHLNFVRPAGSKVVSLGLLQKAPIPKPVMISKDCARHR